MNAGNQFFLVMLLSAILSITFNCENTREMYSEKRGYFYNKQTNKQTNERTKKKGILIEIEEQAA